MGIVTGHARCPGLAAGTVPLNVLGMKGEAFIVEDTGPIVALVTERISIITLGAAILLLVIILEQTAKPGTMRSFGAVFVIAAVTVGAGDHRDVVGIIFARRIRGLEADDKRLFSLGQDRVEGRVGCPELFRFVRGTLRQIGTGRVAFKAEFVLIDDFSNQISDPPPLHAGEGAPLLGNVGIVTINTFGVAGGVDQLLGENFTRTVGAAHIKDRMAVGLAQFCDYVFQCSNPAGAKEFIG